MIHKSRFTKALTLSLLILGTPFGSFGFNLPDEIKPENGALFDKAFFPELSKEAPEQIFLEGMVALYPGRVLNEAPENSINKSSRNPLIESLPRGITYIRVYDIEKARQTLIENIKNPALIWDFRFLEGDYADALMLLQLFPEIPDPNQLITTKGKYTISEIDQVQANGHQSDTIRDHPVLILINQKTRGAIEAAIEALQGDEKVMTVGTESAGATGSYKPVPGVKGFWVIEGEVQPNNGVSLLGIGVQPTVPVHVTPGEDFTGYQLIESGSSASTLLRTELPNLDEGLDEHSSDDNNGLRPVDRILQRAVDIIIALQVLGKLPQ